MQRVNITRRKEDVNETENNSSAVTAFDECKLTNLLQLRAL